MDMQTLHKLNQLVLVVFADPQQLLAPFPHFWGGVCDIEFFVLLVEFVDLGGDVGPRDVVFILVLG